MSFDEQPDGDPHGECAAEIRRIEAERDHYKAALHEVVFVCRTKNNMKQKAREALFSEQTTHFPD